MQNLVPQFILEKHATGEISGQLDVASLFVDISGFSTVTSTLAQHGSEAAEVMADVMCRVFDPLVDAVYAQGGFITTFAGDGFTALFPSMKSALEQPDYLRALAAALFIQNHMITYPVQDTPFGHFPFAVKLGLGSGQVDWGILQPDGESVKAAYYFGGPAVDSAAAAEHHAQPGNITFSPEVVAALNGCVRLIPASDGGFMRLLALAPDVSLPQPVPLPPPQAWPGESAFVPSAILERGALTDDAGDSAGRRGLENGEFRQVVSLFINLMSVREREDLLPFIQAVFSLQRQYGGYLARVDFGDKGCNLLLFWGTPTSTEKDLESALHFALALGEHTPGSYKAGITYRMMYAGLAGSARRGEWTCYGEGVNYAARLMIAAPWGGIWLDERVANRAGGQFVIEKIGERQFKGFAQPQPVYALLEQSTRSAAAFYQGEMVGRQSELTRLHDFACPLFASAETRYAGILAVEGEAGLGKSRLVAEFLQQLTAPPTEGESAPAQWALCQTDQTLRAPLNPFRYWLRNYFAQSLTESAARNKRTFGRVLDQLIAFTQDETLQQELNRGRSFLGALLELFWDNSPYAQADPQGRHELTFTALKALILAESLRLPLVLDIEDAQYLDDDSQAFLQRLVREVNPFPLAILATARPRRGQAPLFGNLPYTSIDLEMISNDDMRLLAQGLLGGSLDEELSALLVERAEGNPFFAEQILLYLREGGVVKETEGVWCLTRKRAQDPLPTDVRLVFTARLDRLVKDIKDIVQTAAVLGREFDVQVLARMLQNDPHLVEKMTRAADDAIWQAISQVRFLFKHALLRDAAYEMQLRHRRRELHQLAAQSLEQLYPQEIEQHYDEIAYHYEAAFQQGLDSVRTQAVQYLERAGQRSAQAFENAAAIDFFSRALQLLEESEQSERFALLLAREAILHLTGDRTAQAADLAAAQSLADAWKRPAERAEVALRQAHYANATGDYPTAIEQARTASAAAQAAGQVEQEAAAQLAWGEALYRKADYPASSERLAQAQELAQAAQQPDLEARILIMAGNVALNQANYETARQHYAQAHALAQQAGVRRSEGSAQVNLGNVALYQGDYPLARQHYIQGLAILRQVGDRAGEGKALNNLGLAAKRQGDYAAARDGYAQGLQIARQVGDYPMESMLLSNLGDVLADQGEFTAARAHYTQGLEIARQIGNRQSEGIGLGSLGIVALRQGDYAAAQDYLEQGLALFRQIGNRWAEAVGLIHLGEVALSRGEVIAAQQHFSQSLELATQIGDRQKLGEAHNGLGQAAFRTGDYAAAQEHYSQSLELARQIGDRKAEAKTLHNLAQTGIALGQVDIGRAHLLQAFTLHEELGQPQHMAEDLASLALLAWQSGAEDDARTRIEVLLPILESNPGLEGAQRPQHIILEVFHLLEALKHPRAATVLANAQAYLQERAAALPDDAARRLFLENIPEHQALLVATCATPPAVVQPDEMPQQAETTQPEEAAPPVPPQPTVSETGAASHVRIKNLDQAGLSSFLEELTKGIAPGAVIVINIEHVTIENIYITGTPPPPPEEMP
ncbi:MAG: tetratricopeptide repeat protein [Anaerolineales bacterium]|nr:tetratricopeptide repeat protein [Anaerolineales bacterium]